MQLIKISLISKNNKQRGTYLYLPVVKIDNDYWFCSSIKTHKPITIKEVSINSIEPTRIIPVEYHKANGITS